jgi:hypothetical protein
MSAAVINGKVVAFANKTNPNEVTGQVGTFKT